MVLLLFTGFPPLEVFALLAVVRPVLAFIALRALLPFVIAFIALRALPTLGSVVAFGALIPAIVLLEIALFLEVALIFLRGLGEIRGGCLRTVKHGSLVFTCHA